MYEKDKIAEQLVCKIREDPAIVDRILEEISGDRRLLTLIRKKLLLPGTVFVNNKMKNKRIAYSYYKPREEYNKRYSMLAILAFINRMLDEWDPKQLFTEHKSEYDEDFAKLFYESLEKIKLEGKIRSLDKFRPIISTDTFVDTSQDLEKKTISDAIINEQIDLETLIISNKITPIDYKTQRNRIRIRAKKNGVKLKKLKVEEYNPTEEDIFHIRQHVKTVLGLTETREEKIRQLKTHIALFLDEHFVYNPDNHAFCKYKPKFDREFLSSVEKVHQSDLPQDEKTNLINQLMYDYRNEKELKYMRNLIPPEDTMVRFNRYERENHNALRQLTEEIYTDLSSQNPVENCIVFYDVIDDNAEEIENFKQKHKLDFAGNLITSKFGRWEYIADSEDSTKDLDYNHKLLKNLTEKSELDRKIANSMLKARAKKDSAQLSQEDKENLDKIMIQNMNNYNIPHVDDVDKDDYIRAENLPKDYDPAPDDMIEVGVIEIRPTFSGRFNDIKITNKWQFHSVLNNKDY